MDSQYAGKQRLDDLLAALAVHETSSLTVRYHLPAFGRTSDELAFGFGRVRFACVFLTL